MQGIPGDIVRKITGHRSRELERYQHLSPVGRAQTVDLTHPPPEEEQDDANSFEIGGVDGTRRPSTARSRERAPSPRGARCQPASGIEARTPRHSNEVRMAGSTGLEPATSDVTGRRSNQLNYDPAKVG